MTARLPGAALLREALARSRRGVVFAGHGVTKRDERELDRRVEHLHMPLPRFAAIVDALEELDFDFLPMEQVIALIRGGRRHTKHWACFTFDDGYQNNLDVLLPFMAARQIPFTVVVSTHHVATGQRFPTFWLRYAALLGKPLARTGVATSASPSRTPDAADGRDVAQLFFERHMRFASWDEHERIMAGVMALFTDDEVAGAARFTDDAPLTTAELQRLARHPLVHVGSHAHHHAVLHEHQDAAVVEAELAASLRLLRDDWCASPSPVFCYPNGDWSPRWARAVEAHGFPLGLLSSSGFVGPRTHPQMVPRFWLNSARRAQLLAALAVVGNPGLRALRRRAPPTTLQ